MKLGDLNLTAIKIGNDPIQKVYLGTELVWVNGPTYPMDIPGTLKVFSFRKLTSLSTKAIKAHRLSDSASLDIGWDGDVIDEAALVTFSQGGDVVYEWYNQVNDLLEAVIHINGLTEIPYIVRNGVVEKQGGKVTNWWKDGRNRDSTRCNLVTTMADEPDVSVFTVFDAKDKGDLYHISVINGLNDSLYDVWQMNSTSAPSGDLSMTRLKNNVPFTPTNRDDYYRNYILGSGLMLMENRTVSMGPLNLNNLYWTLVNGNGALDPTPTTRPEVIIMDNSVVYDPTIIANDIINYYNLNFEPETMAYMDSIGVTNDTTPTAHTGIDSSQLWLIMNDYKKSLKATGLDSLISVDYPMVGGTATTNAINMQDPTFALVSWNGGWVHDELGAKGNGNDTYGDITVNHNELPVIEVLSNGATAVVGTNEVPVRSEAMELGVLHGGAGSAAFVLASRVTAFGGVGGGYCNKHGGNVIGTTIDVAMGIQTIVRTSLNDNSFYKNGVHEVSTVQAAAPSNDLVPKFLRIGGYNNGGFYVNGTSNQRIQGITVHKGLNPNQVIMLRDIINKREEALNRKTWASPINQLQNPDDITAAGWQYSIVTPTNNAGVGTITVSGSSSVPTLHAQGQPLMTVVVEVKYSNWATAWVSTGLSGNISNGGVAVDLLGQTISTPTQAWITAGCEPLEDGWTKVTVTSTSTSGLYDNFSVAFSSGDMGDLGKEILVRNPKMYYN